MWRRGRPSSCPFFFFFQAEDGIRDYKVTGVQTCALPISWPAAPQAIGPRPRAAARAARADGRADRAVLSPRSPALLRGARFRVSGPLHLHGRILADLPQRRRERGLPDGLPRRWAVVLDPQRAVRGAVRGGDEGGLALSAVPAPGTRPRARRLYRDRGPPAGRRMDRRRIGARVARRAPRRSAARLR